MKPPVAYQSVDSYLHMLNEDPAQMKQTINRFSDQHKHSNSISQSKGNNYGNSPIQAQNNRVNNALLGRDTASSHQRKKLTTKPTATTYIPTVSAVSRNSPSGSRQHAQSALSNYPGSHLSVS